MALRSVRGVFGSAVALCIVIFVLAAISLWLQSESSLLGIWAPHDDALFLRLANATPWLGDYDNLVLAKGAFFPLFLSLIKSLGVSLKLVEQSIYLTASLLALLATVEATGNRTLILPVFAVLALNPIPWTVAGVARLTREPIYQSLTLALVALLAIYVMRRSRSIGLGFGIGLLSGCYWLTREEGIWILPGALVLVCIPILRAFKDDQQSNMHWLKMASEYLFPPTLGFLMVVTLVNSVNFLNYGVFRNSDLRGGPFPQAYGALARIKHDEWKRYVVFPRDARQRAYAISPAARELEPFLDGDFGKMWAKAGHSYPSPWGCLNDHQACNDEILSPWFVWALRDAVAGAGYYGSASAADEFYTRLAREIDTACERKEIPCHSTRNTLAPVWRSQYGLDAGIASIEVLTTLMRLNHGHSGIPASTLTSDQASQFRATTHEKLSGIDVVNSSGKWSQRLTRLRHSIVGIVASAFPTLSIPLFVLACASYWFLFFAWRRIKSAAVPASAVVFLSALLVAVLSRVGLLGFLEATSIPSNNLLYLLPAVPMYLLFIVSSIGVAISAIRSIQRSRVPFPA